ncbi:MAG: DsrE family protein [Gammaproteobacteria bacterium]|nr:DsrE family protein [Gammaproteobacteria bacterium]MCZ6578690.1 DsrE family protein [Gammaproteobacteria bacterium]MCZ6667342.1 DsrE family protein [Gammaproteobacteria bacterium]MCZ6797822.1 DsrE family protein [Gammaproteobacteria bacterium]
MNQLLKPFLLLMLSSMLMFSAQVSADSHTKNKLVIQVSTDDPRTQKIALNNAVNLQKLYGIDNIIIEIVAYGPGLGLMTEKSIMASRVTSLAMQDITFSACGNTMKKVAKKTGKMPKLLEGVGQVTAGVARIMELQQQGYAYIRP